MLPLKNNVPSRSVPIVSWTLIGLNVLIFFAMLAAYLLFFPSARVITLVPIFFLPWFVEIPALFYLGFWFVSQLLNGVRSVVAGTQAFGGVAWWAHVGGFVAGLVLAPLLARGRYVRRVYADEYSPW